MVGITRNKVICFFVSVGVSLGEGGLFCLFDRFHTAGFVLASFQVCQWCVFRMGRLHHPNCQNTFLANEWAGKNPPESAGTLGSSC